MRNIEGSITASIPLRKDIPKPGQDLGRATCSYSSGAPRHLACLTTLLSHHRVRANLVSADIVSPQLTEPITQVDLSPAL